MNEDVVKALKEFQKIGYGLAEPGHLDAVIKELKRAEKLLTAIGGYDLYRLRMDLYSFERMKWNREH